MSELKATTAQEIVRNEKDCDYMDELFGGVKMPPTQVYLKAEVDKVISEMKADYKDACDRLQTANLIKDEQLAAARHHKYKRCLAMARWCKDNADWWNYEQINRLYEQRGNAESFRFKEAHNRFCFFCQMERALAGTCREIQGGVMTREELEEWAVENEVELVFLDDADDAIVGLGNDGQGFHVIYSMSKFIDSLVRSGMTEEDAYEWYSYNTIGSIPSMGRNRPIMLES